MEFLSKFSLEVTRSFSTLLRFTEINDILHQAHKLHEQQIIGLRDLPSFLASEFQLRLKQISSLSSTRCFRFWISFVVTAYGRLHLSALDFYWR